MGEDSLALAVAPETHGAVLFVEELSSVPQLLRETGLASDGVAESEAWWESWTLGEVEGARLRSSLYPSAVQRLYPILGEAGLEDLLTRQQASLAAVQSVGDVVVSEAIREALNRTRELHREAWEAFEKGEGEVALELAFRAVDALWELSPRQVALDLVKRAQRAMGRNHAPGTYSEEELTRIRRLTTGASEALEEGDYPRAIRRAYYACQLLGVYPT